jgi:hypothetical protein
LTPQGIRDRPRTGSGALDKPREQRQEEPERVAEHLVVEASHEVAETST